MSVQYSEYRQQNDELLESWQNPGIEKRGENAITAFVRTKIREDSILDRLMEPVEVPASKLTRRVFDDKPYMVLEKEPNSPAAVSVPFGTSPMGLYLKGSRYEMHFNRLMTRRFYKDVIELESYDMDIRQVVSDNSIRDMLAEKDIKAFTAVQAILGDAAGTLLAYSGVIQWQQLAGGVGRDTLMAMLQIMPATPSNLEATRVVVNQLFVYEIMKEGRDEAGGDLAQDWMKNGWSGGRFLNRDWIITVKKNVVPNNRAYLFSDNEFLGKHFYLEEVTMSIERKYFMLSWFSYSAYGAAFAHSGGLAIADFI
jgi:hypothetical protein